LCPNQALPLSPGRKVDPGQEYSQLENDSQ
jgi:hypothetical protein